jgi:cytochrome c-type biogenesis protein CcmH/NrfG
MSNDVNNRPTGWTSTQAYLMAVICLVIGVAVGYFLRGSAATDAAPVAAASSAPVSGPVGMGGMPQGQLSPEQLKQIVDTQAAPLLKQLESSPNDPALIATLGNLYYDAQQYKVAIGYYDRALKIDPKNPNIRTDLGTAYYYLGDTDRALNEFQATLKYSPNHAQTFFNIGMVKWQAKMDVKGAVAAWQELLRKNPNFPEKEKVQQLIAQASKHAKIKPGTKSDKPSM